MRVISFRVDIYRIDIQYVYLFIFVYKIYDFRNIFFLVYNYLQFLIYVCLLSFVTNDKYAYVR